MLYDKGNYQAIIDALIASLPHFEFIFDHRSTNCNWLIFKEKLTALANKHIQKNDPRQLPETLVYELITKAGK